MSHSPYKGVFSAAVTAVKADLSPDLDLMAKHGKWLLANGCDGLAVLGTTGEANSFGLKERISIIEGLVERGIPGDVLMPGTGCCATIDTINLTQAAIRAGAKGVLMLPPFYYKNMSDQGLFDAFAEVIDKIADDRLKIFPLSLPADVGRADHLYADRKAAQGLSGNGCRHEQLRRVRKHGRCCRENSRALPCSQALTI